MRSREAVEAVGVGLCDRRQVGLETVNKKFLGWENVLDRKMCISIFIFIPPRPGVPPSQRTSLNRLVSSHLY